jgi:hypothetical protein
MAERKGKNGRGGQRKKKQPSLSELYAKRRREFTAADLQKYTEVDEVLVPMKQVIAELEEIHREAQKKRKKR